MLLLIAIVLPFVGLYLKLKDTDRFKYRRAVLLNVAAFGLTGLATCALSYDRAARWGYDICRSGIGPAVVAVALYRVWLTFRRRNSDWGCLAPFILYIQFALFLAFSVSVAVPVLEAGPIDNHLAAAVFVAFMAALGQLHAWAGPILAGCNLSVAVADFSAGADQKLVNWTPIIDWLDLGFPAQWLVLGLSTVFSLSAYWQTLLPSDWFPLPDS